MPFTAQEVANAANALIDYHKRGPAMSQVLQDRPLFDWLINSQDTFPGGKEFITYPVKGVYTTEVEGYSYDDTVSYANPANIKRAQAKWYEVHAGISMTLTELKQSGISVVDSLDGKSTTQHTDSEMVVLTNLLTDKVEDMTEGFARSFNSMLWADGTQDAKALPGILSFILDAPTTGTTFGIDRAQNTWWRNRANLAIASNSGTWANQPLVRVLQQEIRQLRRFGGRPDKFLAGSDFIDAFEMELRAKGNYTLEGWSKRGRIDASVADLAFKNIEVMYDPTLDDIARSKYGYIMDSRRIKLKTMDGEDRKTHSPARPPEKYTIYRASTYTGGLCCMQLNANGVYSIA